MASLWCVKITSAAILISWGVGWTVQAEGLVPVVIGHDTAWRVASSVCTALIWVASGQVHIGGYSIDGKSLSGADIFLKVLAIKFSTVWVSGVSATGELHVEGESPSINLTSVIPISSVIVTVSTGTKCSLKL